MARGSIRLDHVKACPARLLKGKEAKDPRKCKCGPRVVGRLHGRDYSLGHLDPGWAKKSLGEFDDKLHDLRDPSRRKRADRSPLLRDWYGEWRVEMAAAVAHGKIAKRTLAAYEQRWRIHIEKDKLAAMPINAIDVRDLRQFVSRKIASGLSHRYANELLTDVLPGRVDGSGRWD
jgi:hypothetical protein